MWWVVYLGVPSVSWQGPAEGHPSLRMGFFPSGPPGPSNFGYFTRVPSDPLLGPTVVYSLAGPCTSPTASASGNSDGSPTLRQCWHSGRGALVSGR